MSNNKPTTAPSPVPVAPVAPPVQPASVPPGAPTAPTPGQQPQTSPVPANRIMPARAVVVRAGKQPVRHTGGIIRAGKTGAISAADALALGKSVSRE